MIVTEKGYTPVECDEPLPCPFCGSAPRLAQIGHSWGYKGRKRVLYAIVASSSTMTADTFWWTCDKCGCTSGAHHDTAQAASEAWNRRHVPTVAERIADGLQEFVDGGCVGVAEYVVEKGGES